MTRVFELERLFWHYTTGDHFIKIVESRTLVPYGDSSEAPLFPGERKGVWFSTEQYWESTAAKGTILPNGARVRTTMTEMYKMGGGLVRIGVNRTDVALISFEEWAKTIPPKFAARLRHDARKVSGNCKHHWVACDAVPMERWSAVDTYNGRAWVRTPPLIPLDASSGPRARQ